MSNIINSLNIKINTFPGHAGRPGQRGGSLPKGGSAGSGSSSLGKGEKETSKKTKKRETKEERIDRLAAEAKQKVAKLMSKPISESKNLGKEIRQDLKELDPNGEYGRPNTKGGNRPYNEMVKFTKEVNTQLGKLEKFLQNGSDHYGDDLKGLTRGLASKAKICAIQAQYFKKQTGLGGGLKTKYEKLENKLKELGDLGKEYGEKVTSIYFGGAEIIFT